MVTIFSHTNFKASALFLKVFGTRHALKLNSEWRSILDQHKPNCSIPNLIQLSSSGVKRMPLRLSEGCILIGYVHRLGQLTNAESFRIVRPCSYSRQPIFPCTADLSSQLLVNVSLDNEHVLR